MTTGRNERCPCGSGKKYKKCCGNTKVLNAEAFREKFIHHYFIVYDSKQPREARPTIHLSNPMLEDVADALWYGLHLPRHAFDLIQAPDALFSVGDGIQQHTIFLISDQLNEENRNLIERYPPTLYITENSCYESAIHLDDAMPSMLGVVTIQELSSRSLSAHWHAIQEETRKLVKTYGINREFLKIHPILHQGKARSALPNIFLGTQYGDIDTLLSTLKASDYSPRIRAFTQKETLMVADMYHQLGDQVNELDTKDLQEMIRKNYGVMPSSLIITVPGGPRSRKSYQTKYNDSTIRPEEKDLIEFFGIQRAISLGGVWLEGDVLSPEVFHALAELEQHVYARKPNSRYINRMQRKFGKELAACFGEVDVREFIRASSKLIAFTDFPVGLAILPGYTDPLCHMIPITYRPLTPITSTFRYGLPQRDEYYIGRGRGCKVLVIECLAKTDKIRAFSDLAWTVVREQHKDTKHISIFYEEAESIEDLEAFIANRTDIDMLVISAHGTYSEEGVAGLSVGDSVWIPNRALRLPPIVILSACHVAAKGKGDYTINDACLDAGALAVLGTLIPVDVRENALLIQRFLYYISEVIDGKHMCYDVTDAWMRVINANIVSEIMTSTKKLTKWSVTKNRNNKTPFEEYAEKVKKLPPDVGHFHRQTIDIVLEIAQQDGLKDHVQAVLQSKGYVSESAFYIWSGYPEKIHLQAKR
ncbi:SEC-C domain-containing protein [Sporosarcina sp. GW1-11]|uniref:SEC-C domain-containing protein n=1 Tax=Sporosarcina sp. GW1-11 TaxID=2899126 RepID=UPI00294FD6FC|nr:SEC-C domain-containing protein [Sporosarcina sp. GW1-11]MDV6377128.1 SEC-C domain-containing protein [Sporosarcina sp. GW1-11]